MQGTGGSITYEKEGIIEEKMMFVYDEEEVQQNKINKENSKLLFTPEFIPFYPEMLSMGLTPLEVVIYGFIRFYKKNGKGDFYFTDKQLSDILFCSEDTIQRAIKKFKEKDIMKFSHRIKSGGGTIRYVTGVGIPQKATTPVLQDAVRPLLQIAVGNKNKIKENKINNTNGEFEKFRTLYGKKVGNKNACSKHWQRLTEKERAAVLDFVPIYKKTITDKQYQPYPETFLNQRRRENDLGDLQGGPDYTDMNNFHNGMVEGKRDDILASLGRQVYGETKQKRKQTDLYIKM